MSSHDSTEHLAFHNDERSSDLSRHFESLQHFLQTWGARQEELLRIVAEPPKNVMHRKTSKGSSAGVRIEGSDNFVPGIGKHGEDADNEYVTNHTVSSTSHLERGGSCLSLDSIDIALGAQPPDNLDHQQSSPKFVGTSGFNSWSLPFASEASSLHRHATMMVQAVQPDRVSLVRTKAFEATCAVVIFTNAVVIALDADYAVQHPHEDAPLYLGYLEISFLCFYVIEIGMRMLDERCAYFKDKNERNWNIFDLFLVIQGIWERISSASNVRIHRMESNLSFLRLFRLLKMLKLLRMVRLLRMFRELRLILSSIFGCVTAMLWTAMLVVAVAYLFGMLFLQACADALKDGSLDADTRASIEQYWGSAGKSMLSLFMSTMGGQDWEVIAEPLRKMGIGFYSLFLVYIAISAFVVMNIVSSIFLESILSHADKDHQLTLLMQMEQKDMYETKLLKLYNEIDVDGDGEITYEEFCNNIDSPYMQAFLSSIDIDITDARQFFHVISNRGTHPVDIETFVNGCLKSKGTAKSVDVVELVHSTRKNHKEMHQTAKAVQQILSREEAKSFQQKAVEKEVLSTLRSVVAAVQRMSGLLHDGSGRMHSARPEPQAPTLQHLQL